MEKASLEFLNVPKNHQENHENRLEDWHEDGQHLEVLFEKHAADYRKKICSNCSDKQKVIRNCYVGKGLDSNGNPKTSCNHMSKARYVKFRKEIFKHIDFHPMFFNPQLQ